MSRTALHRFYLYGEFTGTPQTGTPQTWHDHFDTVLILDFGSKGSKYSHLITRRCREHNVYAEVLPCTTQMNDIKFKPKGIILSGSPYEPDAPHVDPAIFDLEIPILGICYGLQEMAWQLKGTVDKCDHRELYGFANLKMTKIGARASVEALLDGLGDEMQVWMSHGEQPPDFHVIGVTATAPYTARTHDSDPFDGIQFHPEITYSPRGKEVIRRFILNICGCRQHWTMEAFIGKEIARIREICGPTGRVIGAVSGGVDSTVAAKLMHETIGDRFHGIMVDNGLLRLNEAEEVFEMLTEDLGINLTVVDASGWFLARLDGVEDPEHKRKIMGNTFSKVLEAKAAQIEAAADSEEEEQTGLKKKGRSEWLLQGTLYPDVIESNTFWGEHETNLERHPNVNVLRSDLKLQLIEPLRELFKGEVRALGHLLGIPAGLVQRHPFPITGLATRILGPVTREQVKILQLADSIYIEEIHKAGLYDQIAQAFAVLLPVRAVGVMGDARTYEQVIALRAVQTEDFMTTHWFAFPPEILRRISSRITNEVGGINRVTYDISSKPSATVEWL
ncbi:hypothetical protein C8F01DRAFT_1121530 [Mycena amicta]|nr:hypothetical protein C8F01DRAFT_1121530 [Mycena amicta]